MAVPFVFLSCSSCVCARTYECFGVADGPMARYAVGWLGVWLLPPHLSDDTYCCLCRRLDRPRIAVTASACYAYTWCSTTTTRVIKYLPPICQQYETVIARVLSMPPCRYPRFFCVFVLRAFLFYGLCRRVTGEPVKESRGVSFRFFSCGAGGRCHTTVRPSLIYGGCGWVGAYICLCTTPHGTVLRTTHDTIDTSTFAYLICRGKLLRRTAVIRCTYVVPADDNVASENVFFAKVMLSWFLDCHFKALGSSGK